MKADLAIYTHVLGVPGQYENVALMLSHKMDFNCCANRDGFCKSSHNSRCYGHRVSLASNNEFNQVFQAIVSVLHSLNSSLTRRSYSYSYRPLLYECMCCL